MLACQALVERLRPDQTTLERADLDAVWGAQTSLRDALTYWKNPPRERALDRAMGHAAMSLTRPTRRMIEDRLAAAGVYASASALDQSFERLELGHVLIRDADPDGPDRWKCPVPLIARLEARTMSWDEHLERDADEVRRANEANQTAAPSAAC